MESIEKFVPAISSESPLQDYKNLIKKYVEGTDSSGDDVNQEFYTKIAEAARNKVWSLLFDKTPPPEEDKKKAEELLVEHRSHACFYKPSDYNDFIVLVRDELLKREYVDFWRDVIVKKELGLCWCRDSDHYDDADDERPRKFYKFAGCKAPFEDAVGDGPCVDNFAPVISSEKPLEDYKNLIKMYVEGTDSSKDDIYQAFYIKIAEAARKKVWSLLFDKTPPLEENKKKAEELLVEHRAHACFYKPSDYNNFIVLVRDELLKREIFDFWRDVIVKKELGLCWCRDSDHYDDADDERPRKFYEFAGCKAPFEEPLADDPCSDDFVPIISSENPLEDYKNLMKKYVDDWDYSDDEEYRMVIAKIAEAARKRVWSLLFDKTPPTKEDLKKAEELLEKYRSHACFYAPFDYNDYIVLVRDELLKREILDFWRDVIVKKELGLCWCRDSDYYDDAEDERPRKFYEFAGCKAPFEKAFDD